VVARNFANFGSPTGRANFVEELNVGLVVVGPLAWKVVFVVDGFYWANRLASATVHALIRVDVKHAVALVNAVDRAFFNASLVLHIYARKCDYISHWFIPSKLGLLKHAKGV
jgi:hypothetical protein